MMCGPFTPLSSKCVRNAIVCTVLPRPCSKRERNSVNNVMLSRCQRQVRLVRELRSAYHLVSEDSVELLLVHDLQPIEANQLERLQSQSENKNSEH